MSRISRVTNMWIGFIIYCRSELHPHSNATSGVHHVQCYAYMFHIFFEIVCLHCIRAKCPVNLIYLSRVTKSFCKFTTRVTHVWLHIQKPLSDDHSVTLPVGFERLTHTEGISHFTSCDDVTPHLKWLWKISGKKLQQFGAFAFILVKKINFTRHFKLLQVVINLAGSLARRIKI